MERWSVVPQAHHLRMAREIHERAFPLGHARRVVNGRQVCCKVCHTCLQPLREVLDGELWCDTCETYR